MSDVKRKLREEGTGYSEIVTCGQSGPDYTIGVGDVYCCWGRARGNSLIGGDLEREREIVGVDVVG
jgi:hypothetical protein